MYLVDSNVLIEAKNRYYAFDIAPGFWAWLDHAQVNSIACSIDRVRDELEQGADELATWSDGHPEFFRSIDDPTTPHLALLAQWVNTRDYNQDAVSDFLGNAADLYLVAYAKAHNHVVVTHERPDPKSKKRVKIPDACVAIGVNYTDTFAMLRSVNARFGLVGP